MGDLTTTRALCWRIERRDGHVFGFTDHDCELTFEEAVFRPSEGLTARTLEQATGLSVDNSEAVGALSDAGITEEDILAGRFDGASVEIWRVDWQNPEAREVIFRGTLGEIERAGATFRAELRGLTEALNRPVGRLYQRQCSARLGDTACGVDLDAIAREGTVVTVDGAALIVSEVDGDEGAYAFGSVEVLDGEAAGLRGQVRADLTAVDGRRVELWDRLRGLAAGDRVRVFPGCDRRAESCRDRFSNMVNFRGCPHLPTEDWLSAVPQGGAS